MMWQTRVRKQRQREDRALLRWLKNRNGSPSLWPSPMAQAALQRISKKQERAWANAQDNARRFASLPAGTALPGEVHHAN